MSVISFFQILPKGICDFLNLIQCLCQIRDQIIRILNTAGITDQIRFYAAGFQLLVIHLTMGGAGRMETAGSRICHMSLDGSQFQVLHEILGRFSSAFHAETYHAAGTVRQIFLRQFVIFISFQTAVIDIRYFLMIL